MEGKFVAYYRVSTTKQGKNGYGIEAQKEIVLNYLNGGSWSLLDEFVEVDSGGNNSRVELEKAIRICKLKQATLIVSKLDRLSRDVAFIAELMNSGIKFVVAEMPEMNELTIHIFSAMAQHERKMISERTKKALEQAKKRGVALGNPCFRDGKQIEGSGDTRKAIETRIKLASDYNYEMGKVIDGILKENGGEMSLRKIAQKLNDRGFRSRRGNEFSAVAVKRIIDKCR